MSWPDLNEISDQTEKLLRQIYQENGFCFETRLSMAEFLTSNFIHQNLERVQICKIIDQFLENLNDYISKINKSRDTALFTQRRATNFGRIFCLPCRYLHRCFLVTKLPNEGFLSKFSVE